MNWTKDQEKAIYDKDSNILVSAAAGSGKTAVLVERIIQKIIKYNVDIDKLLVVTFTNAAASEMRERVLEAIYKKLDEEPENENLSKQILLLGKANISTIHAFCLEVIRNNFFELDIGSNFRVASEEEIELIKQDVIEDLFDKHYEEKDEMFEKLVETYTPYRDDTPLKELILNIYRFIQSSPFPRKWLEEKVNMFKKPDEEKDFSKSIWGKVLLDDLKDELMDSIGNLEVILNKVEQDENLEKIEKLLKSDIEFYKTLHDKLDSWDDAYKYYEISSLDRWPTIKGYDSSLIDEAKTVRSSVKDKTKKKLDKVLLYDSKEAFSDIYEVYPILNALKEVVFEFDDNFKKQKIEKNIVDFNDIEHYALSILVKEDESGNMVPTDVAKHYRDKFEEIAIDEYQDSNEVQEFILSTISRGNNIFMVGDVKQSIYKFRQACPALFLDKYERYSEEGNSDGKKIKLYKNFRSRENVLDITNKIFEEIMTKNLGDNVNYTEEEYLNYGADYPEENDLGIAELHIIDNKKEEKDESIVAWKDEDDEEENKADDVLEDLRSEEIEAIYVADKIKELIDSKVKVYDRKQGLREITYKDIVILMRAPSKIGMLYEEELNERDIPVFSDTSNQYIDEIEIQTIINYLKTIDNPVDDIALVATLRSIIGKFNDNELLEIRLSNGREESFYKSLTYYRENGEKESLKNKVDSFLNTLEENKKALDYMSISELIQKIYRDTNFFSYVLFMKNGRVRQANLRMLFERAKDFEKTTYVGLFSFIKFIEKLKINNDDMKSAKIIGENENVVRIMSIHKSKGLEFPVVFLVGTNKKMNLMDLNKDILLHQNVGIGPKYINYDRRITYSTQAREAIRIVSKNESIAEEMRVLYVALTRAKEKLIITGITSDVDKKINKMKELSKVFNRRSKGRINEVLLKKYTTYLEWILLVSLSKDLNGIIDIKKIEASDIDLEAAEKENLESDFDFNKKEGESFEDLEKEFSWHAPNEALFDMPLKTTVSNIKQRYIELNMEEEYKKEINFEKNLPDFMKEEETVSPARRGTLNHLMLQKLDLSKSHSPEEIKSIKEEWKNKGIITEAEEKSIYEYKIAKFFDSPIAEELKTAKKIEQEKNFTLLLDAKEYYNNAEDSKIIVQGVIDLFYEDKDGNIVLVDYKTDVVNEEIDLINRYNVQLKIYKKALEEYLNKEVSKVFIYSLYLNKAIIVNI